MTIGLNAQQIQEYFRSKQTALTRYLLTSARVGRVNYSLCGTYLFPAPSVMQQINMTRCILILVAATLFGCRKDQVDPTADRTVHLAGYVANNTGGGVASYWRNGEYTGLVSPDFTSQVGSLYVDGSSIWIGGSKFVPNSQSPTLIWHDGVETTIEGAFGNPIVASLNGNLCGVWLDSVGWAIHKNKTVIPMTDTAYTFGPMAMVLSGQDVYVSGYSSPPPTPPNYSPPQHAQYWKNGQLIFRESEDSNGLSIFNYQGDVFMAGVIYLPGGLTSVACYWKNGQRVNLTDGKGVAIARSIFVVDTHVYVAGMNNDQAVYWTDGNVINLSTGTYSMANSIFIKSGDVHVGGYQNGHPAYWKNGVRQDIVNQDKLGQVQFVVVGSN